MAAIYPVCLAWQRKLPAEEYFDALGIFHVYSNIGVLFAIVANLKLSAEASFIPGIIALLLALPGIVLFRNLSRKQTAIIN